LKWLFDFVRIEEITIIIILIIIIISLSLFPYSKIHHSNSIVRGHGIKILETSQRKRSQIVRIRRQIVRLIFRLMLILSSLHDLKYIWMNSVHRDSPHFHSSLDDQITQTTLFGQFKCH
jgi:hypothetical protein